MKLNWSLTWSGTYKTDEIASHLASFHQLATFISFGSVIWFVALICLLWLFFLSLSVCSHFFRFSLYSLSSGKSFYFLCFEIHKRNISKIWGNFFATSCYCSFYPKLDHSNEVSYWFFCCPAQDSHVFTILIFHIC